MIENYNKYSQLDFSMHVSLILNTNYIYLVTHHVK